MPRRWTILCVAVLGLVTGPAAAQHMTADPDARGIPTIAPLIDEVDDIAVVT